MRQNPGELKTVQIHQWRLEGWTLGENRPGTYPAANSHQEGGYWYPGTVKYLLENNLYAGVA